MQIIEINDMGKAMDASEWSELKQKLTDSGTNRFCESKIEALPPVVKERAVQYQLSLKQPINACFVSTGLRNELQKAGYMEGYYDEFFDFWTRPEHQSLFNRKEPLKGYREAKESILEKIDDSFVTGFSAYLNTKLEAKNSAKVTEKAILSVGAEVAGHEIPVEQITP